MKVKQPVIALFQDKVSEIINAPGSTFAENVEQPITSPVKLRTITKLHYRNEQKQQQSLPKPGGLEQELSEGELEPEQELESHSPELAGSVEHDSDQEHELRIASPDSDDENMDQNPGQQDITEDTGTGEITQDFEADEEFHDSSNGAKLELVEQRLELMHQQQIAQNLSTQQLLQDIRNYRDPEMSLSAQADQLYDTADYEFQPRDRVNMQKQTGQYEPLTQPQPVKLITIDWFNSPEGNCPKCGRYPNECMCIPARPERIQQLMRDSETTSGLPSAVKQLQLNITVKKV